MYLILTKRYNKVIYKFLVNIEQYVQKLVNGEVNTFKKIITFNTNEDLIFKHVH